MAGELRLRVAMWVLGGFFFESASAGEALPPSESTPSESELVNKLEEVVVTAQRRVEDVQKAAVSISVRRGEDLLQEGRFTLQDILEDVPGAVGGAAGSPLANIGGGTDVIGAGITIRGIQSNVGASGSDVSVAPATAVYVDGVYEGVGSQYDIDHVEVLRGPQGTLYGRSATAGVIAIHTRNPDLEGFGGDATVEFGDYGLQHYTGAVNIPIVEDKLALRVSGNEYKRKGFYNGDDGATENTAGRVKLRYQATDDLSILAGLALEDNTQKTGGLVSVASPDPHKVVYGAAPVGQGNNNFRQAWAQIDWDLHFATLTYEPAYRTWYQNATVVVSGGFLGNLNNPERTPSDNFMTHELRLTSKAGSKLSWAIGTLFYDNHLENSDSIVFAVSNAFGFGENVSKSTKAGGVFSEVSYPITDTTHLTAGLRYDYTRVQTYEEYIFNANNNGLPGTPTFHQPEILLSSTLSGDAGLRIYHDTTYKVRLEQNLAPENLLYAQLSTGFSPGDVSLSTCGTPPAACVLPLQDETLKAYEIGSKNRFLDDRLQVNADVYYYNYGGYQLQNVNVSANPFAVLAGAFSVPVQAYGAEIETLFQLSPADRIALNLAYTNAYYVHKPALFAQFVAEDKVSNLANGVPTGAVPVTVNGVYVHQFNLPGGSTMELRADGRYLSNHSSDLTQQMYQDGLEPLIRIRAQVIGDVSSTWTSRNRKFSLTGYVRNVSDDRYVTGIQPSRTTPYTYIQYQYEPRTYGFIGTVHF
ncbi:MAG: TonB-dependent receptor [Gammaproteobacteria bacterium]|nr:TonB-dependent receptor [Gammaproteobacteria bacterium]